MSVDQMKARCLGFARGTGAGSIPQESLVQLHASQLSTTINGLHSTLQPRSIEFGTSVLVDPDEEAISFRWRTELVHSRAVISHAHAIELVRSRTPTEPWVVLWPEGHEPGTGPYWQCFGALDGMVVEGGTGGGPATEYRVGALPEDRTPTYTGTQNWGVNCWTSEVLTINDALPLMRAFLRAPGAMPFVRGYSIRTGYY